MKRDRARFAPKGSARAGPAFARVAEPKSAWGRIDKPNGNRPSRADQRPKGRQGAEIAKFASLERAASAKPAGRPQSARAALWLWFCRRFERRGNLALAEPRRLSCESWRGMERMTAQGLLDALEPRRPKTPAPGRRCSSAGGGRGLAKPTPGAERAARRRNYPNLFDILLQEFRVRAEPHENIMRLIDNPIKRAKTRSALRRQIAKLGRNGRVLTNSRRNYSFVTPF